MSNLVFIFIYSVICLLHKLINGTMTMTILQTEKGQHIHIWKAHTKCKIDFWGWRKLQIT
jgi:hypothetical protein